MQDRKRKHEKIKKEEGITSVKLRRIEHPKQGEFFEKEAEKSYTLSEAEEECILETLPTELWLMIVNAISLKSVCALSLVNKFFNSLAMIFWQDKFKVCFPDKYPSLANQDNVIWQNEFEAAIKAITPEQLFAMKLQKEGLDFYWNRYEQLKEREKLLTQTIKSKEGITALFEIQKETKYSSLYMAIFCKRDSAVIYAEAEKIFQEIGKKFTWGTQCQSQLSLRSPYVIFYSANAQAKNKDYYLQLELSNCWQLILKHNLIDQAHILLISAEKILGKGIINYKELMTLAEIDKKAEFIKILYIFSPELETIKYVERLNSQANTEAIRYLYK